MKIVEHEAGQFEHWVRSQGVVPTIRALREQFAQVADAEVGKTLDLLARKEHTPAQQREAIQRLVQLVVNKLLHPPTAALREALAGRGRVARGGAVRSVRPRAERASADDLRSRSHARPSRSGSVGALSNERPAT